MKIIFFVLLMINCISDAMDGVLQKGSNLDSINLRFESEHIEPILVQICSSIDEKGEKKEIEAGIILANKFCFNIERKWILPITIKFYSIKNHGNTSISEDGKSTFASVPVKFNKKYTINSLEETNFRVKDDYGYLRLVTLSWGGLVEKGLIHDNLLYNK